MAIKISGSTIIDDSRRLLNVGLSTFSGNIDANGNLDVDGDTELDNLNVSGVSTFAGNINANGNIVGDSATNITGIAGVTASTLTGTLQTAAQTNITSLGTLSALNVSGISTLGLLKVQGSVDTVTLMHQYAGASEVHFKSLSSAQAIDYKFFGASNHTIADLKDGGSVDLYYDSSKKFETKSDGVDITGELQSDSLDVDGAANIQGVLTMQSYIQGTGPLDLYGSSSSSVGLSLATDGNITIPDKIIHASDTDTAIRFPAANTVTVETAGSERLRVRNNGVVAIGTDESTTINSSAAQVQIFGAVSDRSLSLMYAEANSSGPQLNFAKGRDVDNSASTAVNSGDLLGSLHFAGADGSDFNSVGAEIVVKVDGTPGSNDMPGRIEFKTTSDGASTTTERLRITSDGLVKLPDNVKFVAGTDGDLEIYHASGQSIIDEVSNANDLLIRNSNTDRDIIFGSDDGSGGYANYIRVDGSTGETVLYHYGSEKLATKSGGVEVTGTVTATTFSGSGASLTAVNAATLDSIDSASFLRSDATDIFTGTSLTFNDDKKLYFGTDDDGQIYFDGSNLLVQGGSSGTTYLRGSSVNISTNGGSGGYNAGILVDETGGDARVRLQFAGATRLETTSAGVTVSGTVSATTFSGSGASLTNLPAPTTITIADESSDTTCFPLFVTAATGDLAPKSGSNLTFNSSTGALTATSLSSNDTLTVSGITNLNNDVIFDGASYNASWDKSANTFNFADNAKATFGDGGDLKIYHNGSVNYLAGNEIRLVNNAVSESMAKFIADGAVELYFNDIKKFETKSDGIDVTGEVQCDSLDVDGAASFNGGNVSFNDDDVDFMGAGSNASWDYSDSKFRLNDNTKISFGNGLDLEIYHDGSHSYIEDNGTGAIKIKGDDIRVENAAGRNILKGTSTATELYFDNGSSSSKKFETKSDGIDVTGEVQCDSLDVDGAADITGNITAGGNIVGDNSTNISGINSVTATKFVGDGSELTGIAAGGSAEFNTGITSTVQATPLSFETTMHTFPSTSGRQYVIESINVANVDESVGVGTTVNIIASIQDATAGEQTYIAYNVPIVTGGTIELLKNPIVAGPSDVIRMWTTSDAYVGVNNAADVYINYAEHESTDFISKFASNTTINSTDTVTLYTSTSNPTMIEKIGFANRTDTGDFPVSIKVTSGTTTSYLAKNLIIPRYSTVDILDRPKRIETDAKIEVEVGSTETIDVIIAGKKITS